MTEEGERLRDLIEVAEGGKKNIDEWKEFLAQTTTTDIKGTLIDFRKHKNKQQQINFKIFCGIEGETGFHLARSLRQRKRSTTLAFSEALSKM